MTIVDRKHEQGLVDFFGDAELVQKFVNLEKSEQMIEFMWKVPSFQVGYNSFKIKIYSDFIFKNCLKDNSEQIFGKSDGDTRRFREMGNKLFGVILYSTISLKMQTFVYEAGNDKEAIKMFNKAITKAPVKDSGVGRDLSLAIANRSAALFKLGFFKLALEDIEFALVSGYPKELRYRLYNIVYLIPLKLSLSFRYKLFERKIRILVNLKDKDSAFDIRSNLILALKDSTLDEDKKCKIENEIDTILEALENKASYSGKDSDEKVLKHKLGKTHSHLPYLSINANIEFDPVRGRFAVANK